MFSLQRHVPQEAKEVAGRDASIVESEVTSRGIALIEGKARDQGVDQACPTINAYNAGRLVHVKVNLM